MRKPAKPPSEKSLKALLEQHGCSVPLHEIRTRFLGNIATPDMSASPMQMLHTLWGGELPVFDGMAEAQALVDALIKGLWNELTRHQKRSQPFRLTRISIDSSAESLARLIRVRLQELDGFLEGLFNGNDAIDLPERAHHAVRDLREMRALVAGLSHLLAREAETYGPADIAVCVKQMRELTRIMETEIHEAVLSCTRARRQTLDTLATTHPTVQ